MQRGGGSAICGPVSRGSIAIPTWTVTFVAASAAEGSGMLLSRVARVTSKVEERVLWWYTLAREKVKNLGDMM